MKAYEVDFSDEFVKGFKTEKEFLEEMSGQGYLHIFHGPKRQELLKEVYAQHNPKKESEKASADKGTQ